MNKNILLSLTVILSLLLGGFALDANAQTDDIKVAARKVLEANQSQVFAVKSMVKVEATLKGQQVVDREMPAHGSATVIADRLLVTSYRTIKPKTGSNIPGYARAIAQGLKIKTEVKEIKLIDESGEEFAAKLVLHDQDLDLAFLALDAEGDNAASWSSSAVDISSDGELQHMDDVVYLSRAGESMRFQASLRVGQVHTIVKRPRLLYATSNSVRGAASFNAAGKFIGLGIRKASDAGGEFNAVLPAKYIRKLLPQAIEKATSTVQEKDQAAESGAVEATKEEAAVAE